MTTSFASTRIRGTALALLAGIAGTFGTGETRASDHLDTPTVSANPQADIGDLFAWTSYNARKLNLVMTVLQQRQGNAGGLPGRRKSFT